MKLIVGLGNPDKKYALTRHNVGWMFLNFLAGSEGWQNSKKAQALYFKTEINKKRVELLKPTTYMNDSGISVAYALKNHNLTPANLIVIHDDKDIPLGKTKIQTNRGSAGHNGVQSIIDHLGTKDFLRIRVGVAPAPANDEEANLPKKIGDTATFVLHNFSKAEQKILQTIFTNINEEIKKLVK